MVRGMKCDRGGSWVLTWAHFGPPVKGGGTPPPPGRGMYLRVLQGARAVARAVVKAVAKAVEKAVVEAVGKVVGRQVLAGTQRFAGGHWGRTEAVGRADRHAKRSIPCTWPLHRR